MSQIEASPQKTWAVVIGLDRYQAGSEWNLDGPVNDACSFVEWLRRRGVPPDQILLFLSPLQGAVEDVAAREAEVDPLHKVFERELPAKKGDLLIVFWGGHGALDGDTRLLFCADAVNDRKYHLNLNDLLHLLRTSHYPSFDNQIVIVDACANYLNWMDEPASLPKRTFGKGRMASPKNQFILYSAADGEAAINDQTRKTGDFSRFVLDWLQENANAASEQWPPDLELMARAVRRHFDELRNQGDTHQTPICIRWKSWQGDEDNLFGNLDEANQRSKLMAEVREQLRQCPVDTDTWRSFYDLTIDYIGRNPTTPRTRDGMVHNLALASPQPDFPHPVFEFLWRAAESEGLADLKRWVEEKINDKGKLRNLRLRIETEPPEPVYYLLVEFYSSASAKRRFGREFKWWLWHGSRKSSVQQGVRATRGKLEDLKKEFFALLKVCQNEHRAGAPHLEFFLEDGMLSLEIDQWEHRKSALGALHSVAIRLARRPEDRGAWFSLTGKIRRNQSRCREPRVHWLADLPLRQVAPALTTKPDCGPLFGLSSPPDAALLQTMLECGAPFFFWQRPSQNALSAFKACLEEVAKAGHLDEFPLRIRELREKALEDNNHPKHFLTLVWDDPDRVPVERGLGSNE